MVVDGSRRPGLLLPHPWSQPWGMDASPEECAGRWQGNHPCSPGLCPSAAALTSSQSDGSWGGLPLGWKRWTSAGPDSHRLTSLGCQRISGETPRLDFHPYIQLWFGICLAPSPATTRRGAAGQKDRGQQQWG